MTKNYKYYEVIFGYNLHCKNKQFRIDTTITVLRTSLIIYHEKIHEKYTDTNNRHEKYTILDTKNTRF